MAQQTPATWFASLSVQDKTVALSQLVYEFTLIIRDMTTSPFDDMTLRRLRGVGEMTHRIMPYLIALNSGDDKRFGDPELIDLLFEMAPGLWLGGVFSPSLVGHCITKLLAANELIDPTWCYAVFNKVKLNIRSDRWKSYPPFAANMSGSVRCGEYGVLRLDFGNPHLTVREPSPNRWRDPRISPAALRRRLVDSRRKMASVYRVWVVEQLRRVGFGCSRVDAQFDKRAFNQLDGQKLISGSLRARVRRMDIPLRSIWQRFPSKTDIWKRSRTRNG